MSRNKFALGIFAVCIVSSIYPLESVMEKETIKNRAEAAGSVYTDDLYLYEGDRGGTYYNMGKRVWISEGSQITCRNLKRVGSKVEGDIEIGNLTENSYIEIPLYFYPQYEAELDGEHLRVGRGDNGVVRVYLKDDSQSGKLKVHFQAPAVWRIAELISVVSWIGVVIGLYLSKRRNGNFFINERLSRN